MRRSLAVVVALALALLLPASATAVTRYVMNGGQDNTNCAIDTKPCATVFYAVGHAADGDTIQIGPGAYTETIDTEKVLTFVGAGAGTIGGAPGPTTIRGPQGVGADGSPAFVLRNGGTLRSLRAVGGIGANEALTFGHAGASAIEYPSIGANPTTLRLESVTVVGGNGGSGKTPFDVGTAGRGIRVVSGPGPVALSAEDSEFAGGTGFGFGNAVSVDGPSATAGIVSSRIPAEKGFGPGVVIFDGGQVTLDTTDVSAEGAATILFDGSLSVRRSRLTAEGAPFYVSGSNDESPEAELIDSLVVSNQAEAVFVESEEQGSAAVTIRGSTLIGHGISAVTATRDEEGVGPASITITNSIARHFPPPGLPIPPADLLADRGSITAGFSSFTSRVESNGGTVTPPGSGTNLAGDPLFVDPVAGSYALQGTSPLIDRGDPSIVAPGQVDLSGNPRSLDGNLDCLAAPDIGAYEVSGRALPCDPAPTVSRFGMTNRVFAPKGKTKKRARQAAGASARGKGKVKRGTKFTYALSEPARVRITIERKAPKKRKAKRRFIRVTTLSAQEKGGRQSTPFSGRVRGRPLRPGSYRAQITATDAAGQASAPQRVSFRIVAG